MLLDIVRAPVAVIAPAIARPLTTALSARVIVVSASMLPSTTQPAAIVAEVPTCQKMLDACAPFFRITLQPGAVSVRVEPGIWKTHTALGSPWASRVRLAELISNEFRADT